jgi:acid stress-induced BolA-like protein IbaG/YrbA
VERLQARVDSHPGRRVVEPKEIQARIERSIPGTRAQVEGADAHFSAVVVSGAFEGKSRVEQHRMIYDLFKHEMENQTIHALALQTRTPSEAARG